MAVDTLAPKNYKKAAPRLMWDKAEREFAERWREEMKAHCEQFDRPQDWELLKAIEDNLLDPRWGDLLPVQPIEAEREVQ